MSKSLWDKYSPDIDFEVSQNNTFEMISKILLLLSDLQIDFLFFLNGYSQFRSQLKRFFPIKDDLVLRR